MDKDGKIFDYGIILNSQKDFENKREFDWKILKKLLSTINLV